MEVRMSAKEGLNMPEVIVALAAKEWEAMEAIKGDVCQWLASILQLDVISASFLDTLDSGVEVCKLAGLIQQAATEAKEKEVLLSFQVPMEPLNYSTKTCTGLSSFYARDNVSNFISWCRGLGIQEAVMFESEGLVLHKDEKRVILCLLDVARFAERVGIPPPQLVRMEREIEALESLVDVTLHGGMSLEDETENKSKIETKIPSPDPNNTFHESLPLPPKPDSSVSNNSKRRCVSRIPVRRSRRQVGGTTQPLPARAERTSRKRARGSDEEEPPAPSHKRTRVEGEGGRRRAVEGEKGKVVEAEEAKKSLDESVMRKMAECTCQNKIQVTNCGNGKFIVEGASGRTMTTYARLMSDRLMVRVGGGWDTLDHFLLKHDPCRVHTLTSNR